MLICNIKSSDDISKAQPCVVALGNFDGVHIGHAALLQEATAIAKARGAISAVFTFAKHPETVLAERNSPSIVTLDEKLALFESFGVECVYLADFNEVRDYSPERFVNEILKLRLSAVVAVCGYDFKFGCQGAGSSDDLKTLMNGEAVVIPPVKKRGRTVSSTLIRAAVEDGDTEYAAEMLGRPFFIDFPVLHGKELGRKIGVPTINQNFPEGHVIPARGVYACKASIGQKEYPAVSNVGIRPTVGGDSRTNCETHIIGFTGWLYGQKIKVSFYKKLRDEIGFSSLGELTEQIKLDISKTNDYFDTGK